MADHSKEQLTDNSQIEYCRQCKSCTNWGHTDAFGNAYDKSSCDMYPYPDHKPMEVINNEGACPYIIRRRKV